MINLMYVVLMAMLALNVSTDVLKGFDLVGESLSRTTTNTERENQSILADFEQQYRANPTNGEDLFGRKRRRVKSASDSICKEVGALKWAIAREVDGADGNPNALRNKEDLEGAAAVMLDPTTQRGYNSTNASIVIATS